MNLSTVLLVCAIVAGLSGGFAARFRRWGTTVADITTGLLVGGLFIVVVTVVLVLAAGLEFFGIVHLVYLALVVSVPIAAAWIVLPHLLDAERRTPLVAWLVGIVGIAAATLGVWATHIEPFRLEVDEQILGATGATQPLVIGVIADLQTTTIGDHEQAALQAVVDGDPDVVVIPGDLFQLEDDELAERLPEFLGWLRELRRSVRHVIMVNGNRDNTDVLEDLAADASITFLDDELVQLDIDDQLVTFVGLSVDPDREEGLLDAVLFEQLDAETARDDLVIAVSHYPDVVLRFERTTTIDLVIAGHTHGGQVSLPGIGPLLTATDVPRTVAAGGLHSVDGHPIYVSTGVGLERGQAPQIRFGVRPSVALLTIVPA